MTDIAMTNTASTMPARRYGLWALIGSVLALATLGGVWWAWRSLIPDATADQRRFLWVAAALGTLSAAASGMAIAALNAREPSIARWHARWMNKLAKRLLLALQIVASLAAAGAAAALVFEFKLPR